MLYAIGETLPVKYRMKQEALLLHLDGDSLFSCACYSNVSRQEVRSWQKGKVKYGIFTQTPIPFFLLQFQRGFDFSFSVDLWGESTPAKMEQWKEMGNLTTWVLSDFPSQIIRALRVITVKADIMSEFKDRVIEANEEFGSEFSDVAFCIQSQCSNQQMMDQTSMCTIKHC